MRLKRIRLNGFKSFCDDTVFDFKARGITMIVGPNGCGKSNVVDAIRWVLGEQSPRQLRGSAMADVIFAGSVTRDPVNRCEVTLIFDNTDGDGLEKYREYGEIAVTRRLYRTGDSDYLINKTPCRLMDVRDLVMDTGAGGRSYSIVEQGKVDEFITASPAERRIFMEEAAGIVRYKTRRIAAERKLDQTHQNLLRVKDVLAEIGRQEDALRGQMEKAREYLDLKAEVGEMTRKLLRVRLHRSSARCLTLEGGLATAQQQHDALRQTLSIGETGLERLNVDLVALEGRLREERARVAQQERDILSYETRQALARQNLDNTRRWIEETTRAREELQARRATLSDELAAHRDEAQAAARDAEAMRAEIALLDAQHGEKEALRKQLQQRLQALQEGLVECHSSLAGIHNQRQMLQERIAEGDRRAQAMRTQIEATRAELQRAGEQVAAQGAQLAALREAAGASEARHATLSETAARQAGEAAALAERLETTSRECVSLRSRLDSLAEIQSSYEGFGESVRNALRWLDETPGASERFGVVGPLADVVSLPPEAVDWAGAYLAPFLEILLIREAARLPALHAALRDAGFGGVRLWALDTPHQGNGNGNSKARERAFADVLAVQGAHEPVRSGLFGAVHLADGARIPLPATGADAGHGEWLAADGAYHIDAKQVFTVGGAPAPSVGILRRRGEIDALEGQLQSAEAAQGEVTTAREALAVQQAATATDLTELTRARNEQALALNRLDAELAHQARERQRLQTVLETQRAELEQFTRDLAGYGARIAELGGEEIHWSDQRVALERELGGLHGALEIAATEAGDLGQRLTARKVALGQSEAHAAHLHARCEALARDREQAQARLETIGTELARHEQQVARHGAELETARKALHDLHAGLGGMHQQVRERQNIYDKLVAERDRKLEQIAGDKRQNDVLGARMHELELALTEERMRREQWQQQLDAQLQAAAEAVAGEPLPPAAEPGAQEQPAGEPLEQVDLAALEKKLGASRVRLERMAGVNLAAWEEYESLNTRSETMLQQQDDLEAAIQDLKESIRQMNQESRRRFKDTFEAVNVQFQQLFPQIFGGGEASLVLTDTDDLLLSGVDIVAQPPGKKLQSMNLLSGGEKALTAIAMIFAFFLTKPSPYCLLDEVDAPLDDVNVGRFNRLVEGMTDRSQFIMITHNKRTMEIGDVLYGVTMEEAGVSKVVSVDLGRS